jgi:hypothetical protein
MLNKAAPTYVPKWLQPPTATNGQPQAQVHVDPAGHPNGVPTKLSSTATSFVPRSTRAATPVVVGTNATAPAPQQPALATSNDLAGGAPTGPQGAWKRAPAAPTPNAKPSTPAAKPVTPGQKPATPGSKSAAPGQLYRSPAQRPVDVTPAMEAARKATLKKDASSFVPKNFQVPPPLTMVTPPVTPSMTAAQRPEDDLDLEALMPLNRRWSLYFVDRAPQGTEAYDPTLVYEIRSVEDFWRTMNNVPSLTHGNTGSTYYFFRDKIQPKWEDVHNQGGGSWTIRLIAGRDLSSEAIDEIWERLLCKAVGDSWPASLQGNLIGLVAKMRDRATTIQFWVTGCVEDFPKEVSTIISVFYKAYKMEYLSHEAAKVAADERDKADRAAKALLKNKKKRH